MITAVDVAAMIGVWGLTMMIPLGSMFTPPKKKNRQMLVAYAIGMAVVGSVAIALAVLSGEPFNLLTVVYFLGIFVYQWVANAMIIR